jgi:hypothetical protein
VSAPTFSFDGFRLGILGAIDRSVGLIKSRIIFW